MARFVGFPNEISTPIVSHLRDRRIDPFDPVATKDLQNMRLVSRNVRASIALSWRRTDSSTCEDVCNSDSDVVREHGLRPEFLYQTRRQ